MSGALFALRLPGVLLKAQRWARETVARSRPDARPIGDLGIPHLDRHFDHELLSSVRLIACDHVPTPPYEQWGLPASAVGHLTIVEPAGITLGAMVFVRSGLERDESLVFHELVHSIQWRSLGSRPFLTLYGLCLLRFGYDDHPLERIAYALQSRFDAGQLGDVAIRPLVERALQEDVTAFQRQSILNRIALAAARLSDRGG